MRATPEYGPERKVNPVPRRLGSTEKAERMLGFRASVPLDEGLRRLVAWWRAARVLPMTTTAPVIPVARPWMDEREAEAARRAILSGWVTQGPEVAAFEREFAAAVGAPHACAVSSCTTALHLALVALRRRRRRRGRHGQPLVHRHGQRHPLLRRHPGVRGHRSGDVQHRPVAGRGGDRPADEGDPVRASARDAVRSRRDPGAWRAATGCRSIEDAACAAGQRDPVGRPAGSASAGRTALVACFSFHPRKLLSTGDGGMLTTSDADLDRRFRLLRQHGMSVPDTVRHAARRR